ncbi:hypothetical protein CLU79DRAFT_752930 [Phycomyces nitens]|nr:hypothetical protein CLU79DRAFT_752930 [Phycomyces nitens]
MLLGLPTELIHHVLGMLPRHSIAQLSLVSRDSYQTCLPVLYSHLQLGLRISIQQLDCGLTRNLYLKNIVERHTRTLTIICRQGTGYSLTKELRTLLTKLTNIHTLIFVDFNALPVENVRQLASVLPLIENIQFRYCHLIVSSGHRINSHPRPSVLPTRSISQQKSLAEPIFQKVTSLTLFWTDFSEPAILGLFSGLPHLLYASLGANHNRTFTANDYAVSVLGRYCPDISSLSVSLQQVREESLCNLIALYGNQLRDLSIRCDTPHTLDIIAVHASQIKQLSIRAVPTVQDTHFQQRRAPNDQLEGSLEETPETIEKASQNNMVEILHRCQGLVQLEMVAWKTQEIPSIVWESIKAVAQRRQGRDPKVRLEIDEPRTKRKTDLIKKRGSPRMRSLYNVADIPPVSEEGISWLYPLNSRRYRHQEQGVPIKNLKRKQSLSRNLTLRIEELQEIRKQLIPLRANVDTSLL